MLTATLVNGKDFSYLLTVVSAGQCAELEFCLFDKHKRFAFKITLKDNNGEVLLTCMMTFHFFHEDFQKLCLHVFSNVILKKVFSCNIPQPNLDNKRNTMRFIDQFLQSIYYRFFINLFLQHSI